MMLPPKTPKTLFIIALKLSSVAMFCLGGISHDVWAEKVESAVTSTPQAATTPLEQLTEVERLAASLVPQQIAPAEVLSPRPALVNSSRAVQQRTVIQGGRTVTTQLMDGPPPVMAPKAEGEKKRVGLEENKAKPVERKPHVALFLSNTVYDHAVTEMRWTHQERTYRVFVNVDFNLLRGAGHISTEKTDYTLVLGVGEDTWQHAKSQNRKDFPGSDFFSAKDILILPAKENPPGLDDTPEFKALPDVLSYYAANEHQLRWDQAVLKAENAARQRWREAHPEKPKDAVIQFWPVTRPSASSK